MTAMVAPAAPSSITVAQLLRDHGGEIFGWLVATLSSETDASDAFQLFSEDLWHSLARYDGRCSPRTWCYMLARHAAARLHDRRRAQRSVPLSQAPVSALILQQRDTTLVHLRTSVKQRLRALRDQLAPEDQTLLILRVDRDLSWRDIALITLGESAREPVLARHATVLRKRFERAKQRLRALAAASAQGPS